MLTANVSPELESEALAARTLLAPDRQKRFYCPKGKIVGELSISLLEQAVRKWVPRVEAARDRASEPLRRTAQALLESWKHAHPGIFYNRANASTCRALKRLRKRGFLEQGEDNRCIRLTSKGRRMARELLRF